MLNQVQLIGRLGQNPDLKNLPTGDQVCNFSIATTEKWTNKKGEKQEKTEWHYIVAFKKTAELCSKYLTKGSMVFIQGKIQSKKYQDKNGVEKTTTQILCEEVKFLSIANAVNSKPITPNAVIDNSEFGGTNYNAQQSFTCDDIPF